jgi:polysaccharide deacetylase 2 family uncharacterized protein YibQ
MNADQKYKAAVDKSQSEYKRKVEFLQRAFEVAMGMHNYSGSVAEKEERKEKAD